MFVQTKMRFKNLAKIVGTALFALLMFTNIKFALMDDADIASGDISLLGIELNLFDSTYGEDAGNGPDDHYPMLYLTYYNCGTWLQPLYCACNDLRCLYGGTVCVPYNDCG